jgi:hypothetical protein
MSAHFKDADGVVHSIPGYLTHFVPNDRSDPYVLESITVAYASGATKEHRVHREYFDALVTFVDESDPSYPGKFVPGLQMGEFVRFVGSRRAIPAITNYLLKHGRMASILLHSHYLSHSTGTNPLDLWQGPFVNINIIDASQDSMTFELEILEFDLDDGPGWDIVCSTRDKYVTTLSAIIDECEHYREIVDFVRDSTNETYAQKLQTFRMSITGNQDTNGVLYTVNPFNARLTISWFARELYKFPQHVIDTWIGEWSPLPEQTWYRQP